MNEMEKIHQKNMETIKNHLAALISSSPDKDLIKRYEEEKHARHQQQHLFVAEIQRLQPGITSAEVGKSDRQAKSSDQLQTPLVVNLAEHEFALIDQFVARHLTLWVQATSKMISEREREAAIYASSKVKSPKPRNPKALLDVQRSFGRPIEGVNLTPSVLEEVKASAAYTMGFGKNPRFAWSVAWKTLLLLKARAKGLSPVTYTYDDASVVSKPYLSATKR